MMRSGRFRLCVAFVLTIGLETLVRAQDGAPTPPARDAATAAIAAETAAVPGRAPVVVPEALVIPEDLKLGTATVATSAPPVAAVAIPAPPAPVAPTGTAAVAEQAGASVTAMSEGTTTGRQATAANILAATPLPAGTTASEAVEVIGMSEVVKRQIYKGHLRDTLTSADGMLKEGRYDVAIRSYEEALRLIGSIGNRPEDRAEKDAAEAGLSESLYRQALYLKKRGSYDDGLRLAMRASGMGHAGAPKLAGELRKLVNEPPPPPDVTPKPRWREQSYKESAAKINDLMRMARQHVVSGELDRARAQFEAVLAQDPENTEAMRMIEKLGTRKFDLATAELEATKAGMMADVRGTFNPRNYGDKLKERDAWEDWDKRIQKPPLIESDRIKILDKMKAIRIPQLEFRQANINEVVSFLQQQSVECDDVTKRGEERGVNIILNLSAGAPPASAAAAPDPFAAAAGGGAKGAVAIGDDIQPITFSARYITLYEALKIVTEVASLKFRISGTVVMVMRKDAPESDIIQRMYDVLPSVGDKIKEVAPSLSRASKKTGDFVSLDANAPDSVRGDFKEFFENLGVSWPTGSSVKYIPAIGKIVVNNTAENLTTFESVLNVLNVVPYQIEIESRFVEVAQEDLNSLGFEWNLTDNWEVAQKKSSSGDYLGNRERIQIGAGGVSGGMRYASDETATGALAADNILKVQSVLTNPELEFVLHALQQKSGTDLLSAPKVTTQSGLEATLKVVTEYIYPTSFEVTGIQGNNNINNAGNAGNVGGIVEPSNFETREVGVILSVLPEVSPEGQMINLTMSPEVVSEPEWFNYGSTYTAADGSTQQLNMPQPFFHTRSIQTSISIYNGATVVMGGLISENRTTVDDKIPLLGDIPLIGRLFQSRYDQSKKRNLLIFVTARLVDPAGRPVRRSEKVWGESLGGIPQPVVGSVVGAPPAP